MLSLLRVLFLQLDLWIIPAFHYIFMIWVCGFNNILEIIYYYFIIINHYTGIFTYFLLFYLSISRYINFFVLKAFLIDFIKLSLFMPLILYILNNGYIYILDSLYIELSSRGVEFLDILRNPEVIEGENQSDLIEDVKDIRGLVIDGSSDLEGEADDSPKRRGWKPDLAERLILITWGIILIGYFSSK